MIDFNATKEAKLIERIARQPQDSRKPFFCLMSGRGTGKTRTLCELHSELLKEEYHCLSLAITFNHNSLYRDFLLEGSYLLEEETRTKIALEVISRMASVLYGEKLSTIVSKLKARGVISVLTSTRSKDLFKAFLEHAVARVRLTGKRVDYVVVHIDESVELGTGITGDFFSCIRSGILDTIFDGNFTAELVQSSLKAAPIGLSLSRRTISSIKKPTVLSIVPVLVDWLEIQDTPYSRLFLSLLN